MYIKILKNQIPLLLKAALICAVLVFAFSIAGSVSATYYNNECDEEEDDNCEYVECDCDADCGTSAFTGDPFCQGGDVYRNYRTTKCLNPGTTNARCQTTTAAALWYECDSWQTCQSGSCQGNNSVCDSDSDCGSNGYVGDPFCQGGDVYQNYRTYTCNNPGSNNASCSSSTSTRLKQTCAYNQACQSGSCQHQYNNISVQTNSATNISNTQATLNGYLNNASSYCDTYVWFEYGPTTSYGYQTARQYRNSSGAFSQNVNLSAYNNYNNSYNFRAAAQDCQGNTVYGQNMSFYITGSGSLNINKTVKNLTSGSGWAKSVSANPSDMLLFMITMQPSGNQSISNVYVKDYLPATLIYRDQLIVSGAPYSGDITSGIYFNNTVQPGQTITISYQVQVAPSQAFSYGTATLNNSVTATSPGTGYHPTSNATVFVTKTGVYGATTISTGLTNKFFTDSFLLPLLMAAAGIWIWKSGLFLGMEKLVYNKKQTYKNYVSERELSKRVATIQKSESQV